MNFLCVASRDDAKAQSLFGRCTSAAAANGWNATAIVKRNGLRACALPRLNGSGGTVFEHPETGSWLLCAGTWFHTSGIASGDDLALLGLCVESGLDAVVRDLEGLFTAVFYDGRLGTIQVATDATGARHVYCTETQSAVVFSDSSLTLAAIASGTLDAVGVQEFLFCGIVYEGRTLFRDVRKISGGTVATWDGGTGKVSEQRYWTVSTVPESVLGGRRGVDSVASALTTAVRRIGRLSRSPAVDLTGGRDSRAVVSAFLATNQPFTAVVSGQSQCRDVSISASIAKMFAVQHVHFEPHNTSTNDVLDAIALTDGTCDLAEYARISLIHRRHARVFSASVNGAFGELARGYWLSSAEDRNFNLQAFARRRFARHPHEPSIIREGIRLNLGSHLAEVVIRASALVSGASTARIVQNAYLAIRLQHWHGRTATSSDQIWPVLSPWSFRSVLSAVLSVPPRELESNRLTDQMLEAMNPRLAKIALENGMPAIPLRIGTAPLLVRGAFVRVWLHGRGFVQNALVAPSKEIPFPSLRPSRILLEEIFKPTFVQPFFTEGLSANSRFPGQWRRLASLELTLRRLDEMKSASTRAPDSLEPAQKSRP